MTGVNDLGAGGDLHQQLDQALAIARKLGGVIFTEEKLIGFVAAAQADTAERMRRKALEDALTEVRSGLGFDASSYGDDYEGGIRRSVGVLEALLRVSPVGVPETEKP